MTYPAIDKLPPVHPGEILRDELEALGFSARKFAAHIDVPPNAVTAILNGTRGVSAEMAMRLGRAFGTSAQYWMNLQSLYETKRAEATINLEAITPLVVLGSDTRQPTQRSALKRKTTHFEAAD